MVKRNWLPSPDALRRRYDYKVLFVSWADAARGQLAEALLRHVSSGTFGSFSAGVEPADEIHPLSYVVLSEIGVAFGNQRPKSTLEVAGEGFDLVIVLGDDVRAVLPHWAGSATICWSYPAPGEVPEDYGERLKGFRRLRDDLHERITTLFKTPVEQIGKKALELSRRRFTSP
ncbi:MAG: hypothetical protein GF403_04960 [Candidatus Coatesbacteria bacterium]|nr:hypothetical protein [Candidatus Coatesbacteria bacterium]